MRLFMCNDLNKLNIYVFNSRSENMVRLVFQDKKWTEGKAESGEAVLTIDEVPVVSKSLNISIERGKCNL